MSLSKPLTLRHLCHLLNNILGIFYHRHICIVFLIISLVKILNAFSFFTLLNPFFSLRNRLKKKSSWNSRESSLAHSFRAPCTHQPKSACGPTRNPTLCILTIHSGPVARTVPIKNHGQDSSTSQLESIRFKYLRSK